MDYAALRAELTIDPARLGYGPLLAAGSANRVADALNAPTQQALGSVPITPLLEWIAAHGIMARLRAGGGRHGCGGGVDCRGGADASV